MGWKREDLLLFIFPLDIYAYQEILNPLRVQIPQISAQNPVKNRLPAPAPLIPTDKWEEIAIRHSNSESLRQLANEYHVSYAAIRQIIKSSNVIEIY